MLAASSGRGIARRAVRIACGNPSVAVGRAQRQVTSPIASTSQSTSAAYHASAVSALGPRFRWNPLARSVDTVEEKKEEQEVPEFNVRMTPEAAKDIQSIQRWLAQAFPAFPLPDDVALQTITHESWDHGSATGHNRRLSFLGRRAMKFYVSLFLAQRPGNDHIASTASIDKLCHTCMIGDSVGRDLKLAEVMRWTPAVNDGQKGAKETGLFKIRGVTVEALLGAIYHQHGAQAARHFFAARILPKLTTFAEADAERLQKAIEQEQATGEAFIASFQAAPVERSLSTAESTPSTSTSTTPIEPSRQTGSSLSSLRPKRNALRRSSTSNSSGTPSLGHPDATYRGSDAGAASSDSPAWR